MQHVYLFDVHGCQKSIDLARELLEVSSPDIAVVPVNHPSVHAQLARDGRVHLVPCVVSIDKNTGEWYEVYHNDFIDSHFMTPLRAVINSNHADGGGGGASSSSAAAGPMGDDEDDANSGGLRLTNGAQNDVQARAIQMMQERERDIGTTRNSQTQDDRKDD